ncbi:phosphatidylinositol kinase (plasmid) [Saccharobesus litoralis]|uniref:Phosphatidylinositol kinase n=1 Tax=Saccharobesus litoralis TaxID=2172099 RepID=A0A2S0VYA1_9ALTE|nr:type II toxin-antitoxin system HipA family toxin [Saccharobesus litoralis]AWB69152.1 phosphatidylinositol kinase [Saccharobesus litoralis]
MLNHKLLVKRRLSDGSSINIGELAENNQGIFFQYNEHYLEHYATSIAPFTLEFNDGLQKAPLTPHKKLHGVFADSLPDGWGLYLMDRIFRKNDINPKTVSQLERLSYIGSNCLGALYYEPELHLTEQEFEQSYTIQKLGQQAVEEFEGVETEFVEHLMNAGGSGGARPKINATILADGTYTTKRDAVGKHCIIKLTSEKFDLKHEESLVEFCCMQLANACGIETPVFDLFDAGSGRYWLRQDRFDCVGSNSNGRLHMISASGLLDAPFREPSLDYVDLVKATQVMCGAKEAEKLIKRALFNYLISNQDDHAKNFAFLCSDNGDWTLSPFYDVIYSPSPYGQHMTSFDGNGVVPSKNSLDVMARHAGIKLKAVRQMADEILAVLSNAQAIFSNAGLTKSTANEILKVFEQRKKQLDI